MIKVKLKPSKPDHSHCKRCGQDIPIGRNKFCGEECKSEWRKEYRNKWQAEKSKSTRYKYKKEWEDKNKEKVKEYKRKWREKQRGLTNT